MNLYEINAQILDCIDQETGEVMDIDRLEELNMAKAEKVDNVACWVKNLEADVVAFEAQEKAFADRKAAAKRKIDSLKHYLTDALGGQNFSSDRCAVCFRRSKAVSVLDEAAVPAEYMTEKITRTQNKTAIAALLKTGKAVPGCDLVEHVNLSVK